MIIKTVELEISAASPNQFPFSDLPEIAFAGRSNVGKSSLINALLGRRKMAHISSRPGKTRTINFYIVNNSFRFVDFPGYGFASVSKSEKATWGPLIETYLKKRAQLSLVLQLVDSRHEPSKLDLVMTQMLQDLECPFTVVGTKRDKIGTSSWPRQAQMLKKGLSLSELPLLFTTQDGATRDALWRIISERIPEI